MISKYILVNSHSLSLPISGVWYVLKLYLIITSESQTFQNCLIIRWLHKNPLNDPFVQFSLYIDQLVYYPW